MKYNIIRRLVEEGVAKNFKKDIVLSGGLDSSVVVAAARSHSPGITLRTHTIGWSIKDPSFKYARMMANKFKTDHHEYFMTEKDIFESIKYAKRLRFPDPGTCAMQWLIHKHKIDSFMCGEGGDEVFGGYSWYRLAFMWWLPYGIRRFLYELLSGLDTGWKDDNWNGVPKQEDIFKTMTYFELIKNIPRVLENKYYGSDATFPLLYDPLVEYVRSLPSRQIIGKKLLKSAFPEIPEAIRNRRKVGMNMPLPYNSSEWRNLIYGDN